MKPFLIAACVAGFCFLPRAAWGQQLCQGTVEARVEVAGEEFSLADLLARDSCPSLLRAAARVPLGSAPLAGSVRVFEAAMRFEFSSRKLRGRCTAQPDQRLGGCRRGSRCGVPARAPPVSTSAGMDSGVAGCTSGGCRSAASATPRDPRLVELPRTKLRRTTLQLTTWIVALPVAFHREPHLNRPEPSGTPRFIAGKSRYGVFIPPTVCHFWCECGTPIHPRRSQLPPGRSEQPPSGSPRPPRSSPASGKPLVRPGEAVALLWDQDGIRLVVPAICLDPGGAGQSVRARIAPHGRLVRAIVISAGQLRTAS